MKPGISVIVCCYNSALRLPETLQHLIQQKTTGFEWEIIVVDNASTDSTSKVADEILSVAKPKIKYKVVYEPNPGLSNARDCGYRTSEFEYLIYCDDDNLLDPNYLITAYNLLSTKSNIDILGGFGSAVFEGKKPNWFDTYYINFAVGEQSPNLMANLIQVDSVYGAGMIVKREVLNKLNEIGFKSLLSDRKGDQLISGGDTELCIVSRILGYNVWYCKELRFKHIMTNSRMEWSYLKKLYFGFGRMNIYLHAYNHFNNNELPPNFDLRIPFWIDTLVYKIKMLIAKIPQVVFHIKEEGNKDVLRFWGICGEIYEIWKLKKEFKIVYLKIHDLKLRVIASKKLIQNLK